MDIEADPDYISFLRCLRQCDNSFMVETQPHGASSPIRVRYEGFNPPCGMESNRKRIKRDLSANETVNGSSGSKRPRLETDSVRFRKRRKEKKDEGLSRTKIVFRGSNGRVYDCEGFRERNRAFRFSNGTTDDSDYSKEDSKREISVEIGGEGIASDKENNSFEEEREIPVGNNDSVEETVEIESQRTPPMPELVNSYLQGFMLLMEKLCPIEMTIFPGYNDDHEGVTKPMAEPSKSKSMEFDCIEERRVEVESRRKGNKRGCTQIEATVAFPDLSDFDEEPRMDDISLDVLSRPPSEYKDRLIEELKRPFDKCEYQELIKNASLRGKKKVHKDLRPKENAFEEGTAYRNRERTIDTEEDSKSFFDWYPEVENKVKRARPGRGLALLRGFFFWLQNACWEGSFKPWLKWHKGSKVHQDNKVN